MSVYGLMTLFFLIQESFLCSHIRRRFTEHHAVEMFQDAQHQSEATDMPGSLLDVNTGNESLLVRGSEMSSSGGAAAASEQRIVDLTNDGGNGSTVSAIASGNAVVVVPALESRGNDVPPQSVMDRWGNEMLPHSSVLVDQEKSKTDHTSVLNTTTSKEISVQVQAKDDGNLVTENIQICLNFVWLIIDEPYTRHIWGAFGLVY